MYIDGDTHYWPLRFIDKVNHPGKGHLEIAEDSGKMVRYGEVVPGKMATYYRDGKKVHSFKEGRWNLSGSKSVTGISAYSFIGMETACMAPPIQYGEISITVTILKMSMPSATITATANTKSKIAFRREITI